MAKTVLSNEFVAQLSASYTRALRQIDSLIAQNRRLEKNNAELARVLSQMTEIDAIAIQDSNG